MLLKKLMPIALAVAAIALGAVPAPADVTYDYKDTLYSDMGTWRVYSTWFEGRFQYCAAETQAGNNRVRLFKMSFGSDDEIVVGTPTFRRKAFDGGISINGHGDGVKYSVYQGWAITSVREEAITGDLSEGYELSLDTGKGYVDYSLHGIERAMPVLKRCARQKGQGGKIANSNNNSNPPATGVRWVSQSGGAIDRRAVAVGRDTDGSKLYVCVAAFNGGREPGKIRAGFTGCNLGALGGERTIPSYTVMIGKGRWVWAADGEIPNGALPVGAEPSGEKLYACVASYRGSMQPGKLRRGFNNGCRFGYGGKELASGQYQVLL